MSKRVLGVHRRYGGYDTLSTVVTAFDVVPGRIAENDLKAGNVVRIPLKDAQDPWPEEVEGHILAANPIRNGTGAVPTEIDVLGVAYVLGLIQFFKGVLIVVASTGGGEICFSPTLGWFVAKKRRAPAL